VFILKKQIKILSFIALVALVISFSLIGCTRNPARPNTPNDNQYNRNMNFAGDGTNMNKNYRTDMIRNIDSNLNNTINREPNQTVPNNITTDQATRIANKIENLQEVKRAVVTITGNTALVGISTTDNIEGQMTNTLKDKIDKVVKQTDSTIKTVYVTANADLYERIENIGKGIREGRPLSGFAEEIEEIIRRIAPTTK